MSKWRSNLAQAYEIAKHEAPAQVGDQIKVRGVVKTIAEIIYQDFGPSDRSDGTCDWMIEYKDTDGGYDYWKQYWDGGQLIRRAK